MSLPAGFHVGSYRILAPLGAGGMGEVYRATDSRLKRQVAIKVLPSEVTADRDRLARFQREAELLASVNHPHVAAVYGLEDADNVKALVMELVEGPTLADRLANGALPLDEALPIARQIAAALGAAHERGVIHRDLKPANVKVRQDGTVKVLDFGLAKLAGPETSEDASEMETRATPARTATAVILGTATYMSPEQARGRETDKRTDIWAFGAVLYEMLTGARAFEGDGIAETLAAVVKETPDWSKLPANVPVSVTTLIQKCLEKDRSARIADISVAQFLLSDGGPSGSAIPGSTKAATIPPRLLVGILTSLLATALLGASGGWLLGRRSPPKSGVARLQMGVLPADQVTSSNVSSRPVRHALAISPDGRVTVFAGLRGRVSHLYARALESEQATPIPGTEGGEAPFFSSDGLSIGFWVGSVLKRVALTGGRPVTVSEIPDGARGSATWADDGTIFVSNRVGILQVPSTGGAPTVVTTADRSKDERHLLPHALPGERAIIFTVVEGERWDSARVVLRSVESAEERLLIEGGADARHVDTGHLVYINRGTLMAVPFDLPTRAIAGRPVAMVEGVMQSANTPNTGDETGAGQFAVSKSGHLIYLAGGVTPNLESSWEWIERAGDRTKVEGVAPGPYVFPRLSPDGQRVVVNVRRPASRVADIWVYDLRRAAPTRLTFEGNNSSPVWAPDGRRVVFSSDTNGAPNLYVVNADGSSRPERLTTSDYTQIPASWDRTTGMLAFLQRPSTETTGIWVLPVDRRGSPPTLFVESRFSLSHPEFSPDGRWIAYVSNESGGREVYVQPYPGPGEKVRVSTDSTNGGSEPVWAPDGQGVLYRGFGPQGGVFLAAITSVAPFLVDVPRRLIDLNTAEYDSTTPVRSWSINPDGRRFLASRLERSAEPVTSIHVALNWTEELRRP